MGIRHGHGGGGAGGALGGGDGGGGALGGGDGGGGALGGGDGALDGGDGGGALGGGDGALGGGDGGGGGSLGVATVVSGPLPHRHHPNWMPNVAPILLARGHKIIIYFDINNNTN